MVQRLHPKSRKGFNLIESAIVLGVVGLIIGGIWVAAASVYENWKVSKTISDIEIIVKNAQNLISIADSKTIALSAGLTSTLRDAGAFPNDWVFGSTVKSPFWGNAYVMNEQGRFDFGILNKIPRSVCIKLLVRMGAMGAMAGDSGSGSMARSFLGYAFANDNAGHQTYITTFPITPSAAEAICLSADNNWVAFGFGFTRNN
jgi:hypothetical protein